MPHGSIHVHVVFRQQGEDLEGDARGVLQAHQGQTGHVLVLGDAADMGFFHGIQFDHIDVSDNIAKVSIVGAGMINNPGGPAGPRRRGTPPLFR